MSTTLDRVPGFFTVEKLSNSREMTPEGFLLVRSAPIARAGTQLYADGEIPVQSGKDGLIRVERSEDEVFSPTTVASFNGKPIVDEHPPEGKITPLSWKQRAVGVVLNPRRGDGAYLDNAFMYADLLVTDSDAIAAIKGGKRELSAGYDAEYQQIEPGKGRQRNIVGNHVALVDKGRCGPLCSIGDADMRTNVRLFRDRIRKAVRTKDEAAVLNAVAELQKDPDLMGEVLSGDEEPDMARGGENGHHVTINVHGGRADRTSDEDDPDEPAATTTPPPDNGNGGEGGSVAEQITAINSRLDQIEQVLAMLAEAEQEEVSQQGEEGGEVAEQPAAANGDRAGTGDRRAKTGDRRAMVGDSTSLRTGFQAMLSQAETLMPGIALMTFDAAAPARDTFEAMCNFRRKTLEAAKGTDTGKKAIETVMGGGDQLPKSFHDSTMTCDAVAAVFNGAAAVVGSQHNRARQPAFGQDGQRNGFTAGKVPTPAELNKLFRERCAQQAH